jgi:hypothetical protein
VSVFVRIGRSAAPLRTLARADRRRSQRAARYADWPVEGSRDEWDRARRSGPHEHRRADSAARLAHRRGRPRSDAADGAGPQRQRRRPRLHPAQCGSRGPARRRRARPASGSRRRSRNMGRYHCRWPLAGRHRRSRAAGRKRQAVERDTRGYDGGRHQRLVPALPSGRRQALFAHLRPAHRPARRRRPERHRRRPRQRHRQCPGDKLVCPVA